MTYFCFICNGPIDRREMLRAKFKLATPEGRVVDDMPEDMHEAFAEGFEIVATCGDCLKGIE